MMFLVLVNWLSAMLGALVVVTYDLIYTPLKARAWSSTLVGAVPRGLPAVIGWLAAHSRGGAPAFILFSIVFLSDSHMCWQSQRYIGRDIARGYQSSSRWRFASAL